jgi:hypothetical protein
MLSRADRTAAFLEGLTGGDPERWVDFLCMDHRDAGQAGMQAPADRPSSYSLLDGAYTANTPGIAIDDEWSLYFCRLRPDVITRLFTVAGSTAKFVAGSWRELLVEEPELARVSLAFDVEYPSLNGGTIRERLPAADVPPNAAVHGVHPPCVFSGDSVDDFIDLQANTDALLPEPTPVGAGTDHTDIDNYHLFFISNLSVDIAPAESLSLGGGGTWWPANRFPGHAQIAEAFAQYEPRMAVDRPLGGVIAVESALHQAASLDERRVEADAALSRVKRFCTLINVLERGVPYVIARRSLLNRIPGGVNEIREVYTGITYRHRTAPFGRIPKRLTATEVSLAGRLAFASLGAKSLGGLIQRATDSLTLARSLTDRAIAHVLTWSSVECLISQKEGELITNMTLCLLGLNAPVRNASEFWARSKASYNARSEIVHGFSVPEQEILSAVAEFAEHQASILLRHVCIQAERPGQTRDTVTSALRQRALAGSES